MFIDFITEAVIRKPRSYIILRFKREKSTVLKGQSIKEKWQTIKWKHIRSLNKRVDLGL